MCSAKCQKKKPAKSAKGLSKIVVLLAINLSPPIRRTRKTSARRAARNCLMMKKKMMTSKDTPSKNKKMELSEPSASGVSAPIPPVPSANETSTRMKIKLTEAIPATTKTATPTRMGRKRGRKPAKESAADTGTTFEVAKKRRRYRAHKEQPVPPSDKKDTKDLSFEDFLKTIGIEAVDTI